MEPRDVALGVVWSRLYGDTGPEGSGLGERSWTGQLRLQLQRDAFSEEVPVGVKVREHERDVRIDARDMTVFRAWPSRVWISCSHCPLGGCSGVSSPGLCARIGMVAPACSWPPSSHRRSSFGSRRSIPPPSPRRRSRPSAGPRSNWPATSGGFFPSTVSRSRTSAVNLIGGASHVARLPTKCVNRDLWRLSNSSQWMLLSCLSPSLGPMSTCVARPCRAVYTGAQITVENRESIDACRLTTTNTRNRFGSRPSGLATR